MMRIILILFLLLEFGFAKKLALVIGNSDYARDFISNPVKDADLIARELTKVGFTVTKVKDIKTAYDMKTTINSFASQLSRDDIAVVYYAGHGVQYRGENYLMPIQANAIKGAQLESEALNLAFLIGAVTEVKLAIVMLDACRNNNYPRYDRSGSRGLTRVSVNSHDGGMILSYATAPNEIALDGEGSNSPYALAIVKYIQSPLAIETFFRKVGGEVYQTTGLQKPMVENKFYGEFGFVSKGEDDGDDSQPTPNPHSPQMIHIPAGSYTMGSNNGQDDEKPPHKVTIDYDFEIGKYEVTIGEYKKCVTDGGCKNPEWLEKGNSYNIHTGTKDYYKKMCLEDNCPIIGVSWNDTKAYTKWLSQKTGQNYRLPTEAEWEYVARAGTQTKWSFGDDKSKLKNYAWYDGNSDSKTHQVGTKKPNPWGVYDIHGNVWEWCEDWYTNNYKKAPKDGSANTKGKQKYRVIRGGSWYDDARNCRSAIRYYGFGRDFNVGFRVVLA